MGEDVDFFEPPATDPRLIALLSGLECPPSNPEALARNIGARCASDIELGLYKLHKDHARRRRRTLDRLKKLRRSAHQLLQDDADGVQVLPFAETLDDLLLASGEERHSIISRVISAVEFLAHLPLRKDLVDFRGRGELDKRVTELVAAVAEYWGQEESESAAGGLRREARVPTIVIKKKSQASLTKAVLNALGVIITDSELETHLLKVRNSPTR